MRGRRGRRRRRLPNCQTWNAYLRLWGTMLEIVSQRTDSKFTRILSFCGRMAILRLVTCASTIEHTISRLRYLTHRIINVLITFTFKINSSDLLTRAKYWIIDLRKHITHSLIDIQSKGWDKVSEVLDCLLFYFFMIQKYEIAAQDKDLELVDCFPYFFLDGRCFVLFWS